MAFSKKEYNLWHKFFNGMIYKNGTHPYLIKETFVNDLIEDDNFEGAKAASDVFNEWFEKYGLSKPETDRHLENYLANHPVYGQGR